MQDKVPLRERKQLQARERIIRAADDLFRERGFEAVSVSDIVDRAEVGRTSFFRYFGDKQEVVFAREQMLIDAIGAMHGNRTVPAPSHLAEAISQLRDVVVALCVLVTEHDEEFTRHYEVVDSSLELRGRDALKLQRFAGLLADILIERGAEASMAGLAAQVALACYQAAQLASGRDPHRLVDETGSAFERVLRLGDGA